MITAKDWAKVSDIGLYRPLKKGPFRELCVRARVHSCPGVSTFRRYFGICDRVPQGRLAVAQHGSALSGAEPNAGLPSNPMGVLLGTVEFYVSQLFVLGRRDMEHSLSERPMRQEGILHPATTRTSQADQI